MNRVLASEVLSIEAFKALRPRREAEILASKEQRRVFLGDAMMMVFENHQSVWWQVQIGRAHV